MKDLVLAGLWAVAVAGCVGLGVASLIDALPQSQWEGPSPISAGWGSGLVVLAGVVFFLGRKRFLT
jgi:hypothetical protein